MRVGLITLTDTDTALDLANALGEAGQLVTLYLNRKASLRFDSDPDHFVENLYGRRVIASDCMVRLYDFPRMRDPRSMGTMLKISKDMYNDQLDVVHMLMGPAEPWLAVLAHVICKVPVVTTMIVPMPNVGDPLRQWVDPINKLQIMGSDLVIVNGEGLVNAVQKRYKISSRRIVHIPLGSRTTTLKWLDKNRDSTEQSRVVLFFGRADPHKGLEYLIRAQPIITQYVPHARIVIVAHGDDLRRCRTLISDASAFEIHEGIVPNDAMAGFFARASLVVLPYLSASTSGVLLTAYGFGKPVVATGVGCLPEYVNDGITGLLVPPARVQPLADAIVRLLLDDRLRYGMGENARRWVAQERMENIRQTLNAYEDAMLIFNERRNKKAI